MDGALRRAAAESGRHAERDQLSLVRRQRRPDVLYGSDATAELPDVRQACLVLRCRDDPAIPFAGAHQLAFGLADAELVRLDGLHRPPPPLDLDRIARAVAELVSTTASR